MTVSMGERSRAAADEAPGQMRSLSASYVTRSLGKGQSLRDRLHAAVNEGKKEGILRLVPNLVAGHPKLAQEVRARARGALDVPPRAACSMRAAPSERLVWLAQIVEFAQIVNALA